MNQKQIIKEIVKNYNDMQKAVFINAWLEEINISDESI